MTDESYVCYGGYYLEDVAQIDQIHPEALVAWDRDVPPNLIGDHKLRIYHDPIRLHGGPKGDPTAVFVWDEVAVRWMVWKVLAHDIPSDHRVACLKGHTTHGVQKYCIDCDGLRQ
jgi:hypothetical protein